MDFIQFTVLDFIDIFVVALILYYIYKMAKGTAIPSILSGILMIYLLWIVVRALNMEMLSAILGHLIGVGVIALIVIFQPEIRRFLQVLGVRNRQRRNTIWGKLLFIKNTGVSDTEFLTPLTKAADDMSATKTGALIVIQQEVDLSQIIETGIEVDGVITASLLKNIFFKNSPLHDGAVIIKESRIAAAQCILPSTQSKVPVSFGMRHRAALGVSEETDAVVIVISEETGSISIARNGEIKYGIAPSALKEEIAAVMDTEITDAKSNKAAKS